MSLKPGRAIYVRKHPTRGNLIDNVIITDFDHHRVYVTLCDENWKRGSLELKVNEANLVNV